MNTTKKILIYHAPTVRGVLFAMLGGALFAADNKRVTVLGLVIIFVILLMERK